MGEVLTGFTHPLVDHIDGGYACVETRVDRVVLTESMADALVSIGAAGLIPVWITKPSVAMSYLARYHLALVGGRWLVRESASALRDPLTGATGETVDRALGGEKIRTAPRSAAEPTRLLVAVSTQSPADEDTELGDAVISLSSALADTEPACWGAHEPATLAWDRAAYTQASRAWMPGPVRWMIADAEGKARFTTTVRRTKGGVEETTTGILLPRDVPPADLERLAFDALSRLAEDAVSPLFGTVSLQRGPVDLSYDAEPFEVPTPLAAIIGPRATRALAPDLDLLSREFGARTVGRARTPALVVGFGSIAEPPYTVAARFAEALGTDQITRLLARNEGAS
jgi:hypothetical protein